MVFNAVNQAITPQAIINLIPGNDYDVFFQQENANGETLISIIVKKAFWLQEGNDEEDDLEILTYINVHCDNYLRDTCGDPQNENKETYLHIAVREYAEDDDLILFDQLLEDDFFCENVPFNIRNQEGITPFLLACKNEKIGAVQYFLRRRELLDETHFALEVVNFSLYRIFENRERIKREMQGEEQGNTIRVMDPDENSALHIAIENEADISVAQLLIAANIPLNIQNNQAQTAQNLAQTQEEHNLLITAARFEGFLAQHNNVDGAWENLLEFAIIADDPEFFIFLYETCNAKDEDEFNTKNLSTLLTRQFSRMADKYNGDDRIFKANLSATARAIEVYLVEPEHINFNIIHECVIDGWDKTLALFLHIYVIYRRECMLMYTDDWSDAYDEEDNLLANLTATTSVEDVLGIRDKGIRDCSQRGIEIVDCIGNIINAKTIGDDNQHRTPLQLAIEDHNLLAVKILVAAGATILEEYFKIETSVEIEVFLEEIMEIHKQAEQDAQAHLPPIPHQVQNGANPS